MQKLASLFILVLIGSIFSSGCSQAAPYQPPIENLVIRPDDRLPAVTARSAVIMEASTGTILYARDMDARRYPASTTKMMTLIVALERGNLDDIVTVSDHAAQTGGSTLWLEPGQQVRLLDLLYGMMMVSGNDATVAVAEHIAGNVDDFAKMMTDKAKEIGAADTSFVNTSGLPDERHYTTAHDLALIAAYGYKNPMFEQIVSTKEKELTWTKYADGQTVRNENQMLWLYPGANGVKTGYTDDAGRCLVAAANRDGVQLITVVLDSLYMWNDSIAMLNYGFSQVQTKRLVPKGTIVQSVDVTAGKRAQLSLETQEDLDIPVFDGEELPVTQVYKGPTKIDFPVEKGRVIGELVVLYDGREIASTPLAAAESVGRKSFFLMLYQEVRDLLQMTGI